MAAEIILLTGETLLTGVHEVDEIGGTASLYAPRTFGDTTTRQRINLGDIVSLTVTDIVWRQ